MKVFRAILASLVFIALLIAVYYIHTTYFRVNVIFYAAIADGCIAAGIAGLLLLSIGYFRVFSGLEKLQLFIIWFVSGYAIAISAPTVLDRSLSFYILEKLQQRGGEIRQDSFERIFTQEYVKEFRLVDVRLTEQLESGTIAIRNGCVELTEKGNRIASFSRYFRAHWLPKKRLLMGEYTDDLTDPFRNSISSSDYTCRK